MNLKKIILLQVSDFLSVFISKLDWNKKINSIKLNNVSLYIQHLVLLLRPKKSHIKPSLSVAKPLGGHVDINRNEEIIWNIWYSSTFKVVIVSHTYTHTYEDCNETEAVFTKREMIIKWNINFLWNCHLGIKHTYSSEFSIGQSTFKTPFLIWYKFFFLMSSTSSNPNPEINFQFRIQEKVAQM